MFGKRSGANPADAPQRAVTPPQPAAPKQPAATQRGPTEPAQAESPQSQPSHTQQSANVKPATAERRRSEEYYDVKTTVFNALIDTIDLTQLAKLDPEAAREANEAMAQDLHRALSR